MPLQYLENPVVFVNSSSSVIPNGRNARAQSRTQGARLATTAQAQQGQFHVLDLNSTSPHIDRPKAKKRRKLNQWDGTQTQWAITQLPITVPRPLTGPSEMCFDPADVLTVATFHIRRIAAMIVRSDPSRLADVLRCRQWACVSTALDRFGKSRCLDSALFCVATKLRQMTGCGTSQLAVLSSYTDALHQLQTALQEPEKHDQLDLLSTTQLLAVYEMLGSLDSPAWTKHIAGATSLMNPQSSRLRPNDGLAFKTIAPIFSDMLLNDEMGSHERLSEQWTFIDSLRSNKSVSAQQQRLLATLVEIPTLLVDAKPVKLDIENADMATLFRLLDRAHLLRSQLRHGLLEDDVQSTAKVSTPGSFDILAMCLAGMVALDRLIKSLRPAKARARDSEIDMTSELCAQLLQLELGASDMAYPATDLMASFALSTFQQQPGFIIVLPGKQ